jgi:hypothetical protein
LIKQSQFNEIFVNELLDANAQAFSQERADECIFQGEKFFWGPDFVNGIGNFEKRWIDQF